MVDADTSTPPSRGQCWWALVQLVILLACSPVEAAKIDLVAPDDPGTRGIVIRGPLEKGDAARFRDVVPKDGNILVALDSPGGLVEEALDIGSQIHVRNFATTVPPGSACYSACALIWISGSRRYLNSNAAIGFHAAYRIEKGKKVETGMANADIGSFLTQLGLGREAVRFITAAPPSRVSLMTFEMAGLLYIDVLPSENDIARWKRLRQIDLDIRAGLLAFATRTRCPNVRGMTESEQGPWYREVTPREGTTEFNYFHEKHIREVTWVVDLFRDVRIERICEVTEQFFRENGYSRFLRP